MPGFTYFLPKHPLETVDPKAIRDAGIEYILGDRGVHACQRTTDGPDDAHSPGVLFTLPEANLPGAMLDREKQVWRKIPGSTAWVGVYRDALPGPDDLVRSKVIGEAMVKLADEREWRVPRALAFSDGRPTRGGEFPHSVYFEDDGDVTFKLVGKYEPLCEAAWGYFEHYARIEEVPPGPEQIAGFFRLAAQALSVNYRVGPAELSLLRVLTNDNVRDILRVVIEADLVDAWTDELVAQAEAAKKDGGDTAGFPGSGAAQSPDDASRGSAASTADAAATGDSSNSTGG